MRVLISKTSRYWWTPLLLYSEITQGKVSIRVKVTCTFLFLHPDYEYDDSYENDNADMKITTQLFSCKKETSSKTYKFVEGFALVSSQGLGKPCYCRLNTLVSLPAVAHYTALEPNVRAVKTSINVVSVTTFLECLHHQKRACEIPLPNWDHMTKVKIGLSMCLSANVNLASWSIQVTVFIFSYPYFGESGAFRWHKCWIPPVTLWPQKLGTWVCLIR